MTTIVIECIIGNAPVVSGTVDPVGGLSAGNFTCTCNGFENVRITLKRGGIRVGALPTGTDTYYTKVFEDNFFTVSQAWVNAEVIYIETIP